jgi:hypothetical protein
MIDLGRGRMGWSARRAMGACELKPAGSRESQPGLGASARPVDLRRRMCAGSLAGHPAHIAEVGDESA